VDKTVWKQRAYASVAPLVEMLARAGVTPTGVTLFGLLLNVAAGITIGMGQPRLGAIVLLFASICDGLDGSLARRTNKVSRFGAFLDSTIDRIDETVVLAGIAAYFLRFHAANDALWSVVVLVALGGSLITSYTRARAEGLGMECKVGWFERPERLAVTGLGLLLGHRALLVALGILTVFSWYTVVQRIRHVQRLTASQPAGLPNPPEA